MISKKTLLTLSALATIVACGKKSEPTNSVITKTYSGESPDLCAEASAEDIAKSKNFWETAELRDEPAQKVVYDLQKGIPESIPESWSDPERHTTTFTTLHGHSSWNNDLQTQEASLFNEGSVRVAEGTVTSRIEKGEIRVRTASGKTRPISLADMFGQPNQEYAVQADSYTKLEIGTTYLMKTWQQQLYLVRVDNIQKDSITMEYRKIAGVSGRNYDLHKCAHIEALKQNAAQTFETIVYDSSWNIWNNALELPLVSKYVNNVPEFEGTKVTGSFSDSGKPRINIVTESHLIDIGGKSVADVKLEDFSKVPNGLSAFLTPNGGRYPDLKKNHTYLAVLFRRESMNYYALRITEVDTKGRWMRVQARLVGHTAPVEFQTWLPNKSTDASEAEQARSVVWSLDYQLDGVPSLFRACRSSEGAQFRADVDCNGWAQWSLDPNAYAGKGGIYRVSSTETFESLTEQSALSNLGQYTKTAKIERGLYIFMAGGYRSREAYAVEVSPNSDRVFTVRLKKILSLGADMPNSDWPAKPAPKVKVSTRPGCEVQLRDDLSRYGAAEVRALESRGYSVSFHSGEVTLEDLKKLSISVGTSTSQILFWTNTEYTVLMGRSEGNSMAFSTPGRGGSLREALAHVPKCGQW